MSEISLILVLQNKNKRKRLRIYTIVTNYSLQAFNANDYFFEECHKLKIGEKKDEFGDNIWINSLFHKNDGYMTPIVLNPYRDNDMPRDIR